MRNDCDSRAFYLQVVAPADAAATAHGVGRFFPLYGSACGLRRYGRPFLASAQIKEGYPVGAAA